MQAIWARSTSKAVLMLCNSQGHIGSHGEEAIDRESYYISTHEAT